jgi:peptidoglycan hydrolase-like protein with peptidoglycan-binding domain
MRIALAGALALAAVAVSAVTPSQVEHVRELQYRLTWAGAYDGPVTGCFGDLTKAAVRRYQRRVQALTSRIPLAVHVHGAWS